MLDDGDAVEGEAGGRDDRGERRGEVEGHADTASDLGPGAVAERAGDRLLHLAGEGARLFRPAAGRRDRIEDGDADVARRRHELALAHHEAAAVDRDRHHRQAGLDRHHEGAGAEARERAVEAAGALREHEQRVARLHQHAHLAEQVGAGVLAIDQDVAGARQVPAEERKAAQRGLGQDPQLEVERPEQHRDVVDALVVGGEHVAGAARQPIEPAQLEGDAGRLQDQPRPGARALVGEAPGSIEERRRQRDRPEHDRVDRDRRDQEEDGAPPVIGRHRATRRGRPGARRRWRRAPASRRPARPPSGRCRAAGSRG